MTASLGGTELFDRSFLCGTKLALKFAEGPVAPAGLEQKEHLRSWVERKDRWTRRTYQATPQGRKALEAARIKVQELFEEVFED